MNILLFVPWDQEYGGVASVVGNLGIYFRDRGHKVIFFHYGKSDVIQRKRTKWGFEGVDLNMRPPPCGDSPIRSTLSFLAFFPFTCFQVFAFMRKSNIEIVNVHFPGECCIYFAIYRWLWRVKLVVSTHGADFFPEGRAKQRQSWVIRLILRASDAVIAPSKAFMQDVVEIFPGVRKKATFIHNGIDLTELRFRSDHCIHGCEERYLLCVAHQNEKKGIDVLIKAFAKLRKMEPYLKLKLVGDGPLRKNLEQLTQALQVHDRVEFLGERNRADVVRLLHGCEIFVLPSRSEPFGIAIIEAMACKKPVIACAVGGVPEIIQDGKNGILVGPNNPAALADALLNLLKRNELRRAIAENGYVTAQTHFGFEKMGACYERIFADLLASNICPLDSEQGIQ